ncbi:hypothetical protein ACFLRA_01715 [Bdellovibrionota bacterium]
MKQLLLSIIVGTIAAFIFGAGAVTFYEWNVQWGFIFFCALCFSLLFNLNLFFIRRWGGCVEKLGGFTFCLFLFLSAFLALSLLVAIKVHTWVAILPYLAFLFIQMGVIGIVSTIFLRSKNYSPPGPGEFWFKKK